ncbi:hypothetical protein M422DRAFT_179339, partial [Sphaerobolus stellatus SS14]
TQLEESLWYQGPDSVDEYIGCFRELVFHLGYVDNANLVVKFNEGLNKSLQTTVVTTDQAPAFDNLEAWIEAVQRVADAREMSKKPVPHRPKPFTTIPRRLPPALPTRTFNYQAQLPIPVLNTSPEPPKIPDGPMPMDVDRTCSKASISNIVCRCCNKTGHIAKFCNTTFNIRSLTVEEKEELLYGLMADLDMTENSGAKPGSEEEIISEQEDFAKCDK